MLVGFQVLDYTSERNSAGVKPAVCLFTAFQARGSQWPLPRGNQQLCKAIKIKTKFHKNDFALRRGSAQPHPQKQPDAHDLVFYREESYRTVGAREFLQIGLAQGWEKRRKLAHRRFAYIIDFSTFAAVICLYDRLLLSVRRYLTIGPPTAIIDRHHRSTSTTLWRPGWECLNIVFLFICDYSIVPDLFPQDTIYESFRF